MEIQIKPMMAANAKDVQRLSEQLGYILSFDQIEDNIREVTSTKNHIAFVALHNENVVGWIHAFQSVLIESRSFIEVGGLVVDENFRMKGVGTRLLNSIKQWSTEKGVYEIRVRSNSKRKEAHQFYLKNGFTEIKEQKIFQTSL